MFYNGLNILFRQCCPSGNFTDNLLIIIGELKMLRQPSAKLAPSTSKLTPDCNNPIHKISSSLLTIVLYTA